ncbi:hypothetical protein NLJ89_g10358 [Agrocybe chaxingu]|uniref:Uncharacterized protein n=1 Tax=Agrocybe chaxingu TaxID=84603 RepID=A0A9W8JYV0_9AGAR|nr:hypothetical protein NLJ89_g10358 [Agrocybe chaxingu]
MSQKKSDPLTASIHPGAPTPENAMDFVLSSIRDPRNPAHCGQCLYGALFVLTITAPDPLPGTEAAFKLPAPLRKNTPFWNSLLEFLVMPRSDEEVERLLKKFAICKCDLRDRLVREYHAAGKAKEEHMMKRMCLELWAPKEEKKKYTTARCAVVVKIVQTLDSALTEGHVRSVAKGLTETWPTAPTDLIPCGADELVESLLRWYRFVPDPLVFHLAAHILHTCRFLLVPSFAKYRLSAVMFDSFYDSFKQITEQLNKLPAVVSITNPEGITMS